MNLFLKPLFFSKIWGGTAIESRFRYGLTDRHVGECWGISGLPGKETPVLEGPLEGKTLSELWKEQKDLFGNHPAPEFPLLVKFIDATDDLSVQVHPDDGYARKKGFPYGKSECWTVLSAAPGAKMVVGHRAKTREEFAESVKNGTCESLLSYREVREGDFFNITPGTVHALGKGLLILEIQQSSDLTYRLYDYNRLENGRPRELHVADALAVMRFPDTPVSSVPETPYFTIETLAGESREKAARFGDFLVSISGSGTLDGAPLKAGDFVFVTSGSTYALAGDSVVFRTRLK